MRMVPLGDVADINPRDRGISDSEVVSFVGMAELDPVTSAAKAREERTYSEVRNGYTVFRDLDILVAKITPCFENSKIGQAHLETAIGVGSTEFHVIRPHVDLDARYLLHFLRQPWIVAAGELRMTGSAGQRRVPAAFLRDLCIPLPQVVEQRRIAAILDKADAIRAKRRQVLAHLDALTQSIFDFVTVGAKVEVLPFSEVIDGMRNGLSPSRQGRHAARVLTLSAVTQGPFDPQSAKAGLFESEPSAETRVSSKDFLICRGNGNKALVGAGVNPREDHPGLVFPDTVIAARLVPSRVDPNYFEVAWRQPAVRRQIEASARTTNGTYKVNQQGLGGVRIALPRLDVQKDFATRSESIRRLSQSVGGALDQDQTFFRSLQSRAFKGEL